MTPRCSIEEDESSSCPLHLMMKSSPSQTLISVNFSLDDQVIRTCPSTATSHDNKKRVSIDERVQVRATIARHEMSKQEMDAVWYTPIDLEKITESCCKQIMKLNQGEILKDKKHCARGLESHTRIRSCAKSMNRNLAYQVVFDEQGRQLQNGVYNDEALSRVYLAASSDSCMWANVVGLHDQKEAENIYDDE